MKKLLLSLLLFSASCFAWDQSDVVELNPQNHGIEVLQLAGAFEFPAMGERTPFTTYNNSATASVIYGATFDGS